jgi:DNA polymerase-3 subunit delta
MNKKKLKNLKHYEFFKIHNKIDYSPIFFIYGEEYYLREKVLSTLLEHFSSSMEDDFDKVTLYGENNTASEAIENLEMTPFLSQYKIVVIRNFNKLKTEDKNQLAEYAKNPFSSSILLAVTEKIDKRKKAEKTIFQNSTTIECKKPYSPKDINLWLKNELLAKNKSMNFDAMHLFSQSIDLDFMLASNELEKLIIYTKDANIITKDDVLTCVASSKINKIFDLQNSLGNRDLKKSLNISENMLKNNESSIFFIVMLTRYFTILWKIQSLRKQGLSDSEISNSHLNEVFYSFRSDYLSQARNFTLHKLREIFALLLQADIDLKSISVKENIIVEMLIYKICK